MTRDDDFTLLLRDYLDEFEGSTPLPDDARNAIRAELPSIRQRPAWWPGWRLPTMNPAMRITLATAAVVAVALLGLGYLRSQNTGDPGLDDPTSTAVPLAFPVDGFESLGPGRYVAADPFPARLTLDVPAGWDGNIGGPYAVWLEKPSVVSGHRAPAQSSELRTRSGSLDVEGRRVLIDSAYDPARGAIGQAATEMIESVEFSTP